MRKLDINEIKFVYVVFYNSSIHDNWTMYPEGVFVTQEGAEEAKNRIYQDFHGNVKIKIKKMMILK